LFLEQGLDFFLVHCTVELILVEDVMNDTFENNSMPTSQLTWW